MTTLTGTQAVGAGALSADVPGAFGLLPYQAGVLSSSWNSDPNLVSGKTAASFHVDFGTPCPPGGGTIDWVAFVFSLVPPGPSGGETLSSYLVRVRRLLHDLPQNYVPNPLNMTPTQYYSDYDLTADINEAIRERDLWSGGSRTYLPNIPLTIGQDTYVLADLFPTLTQTVLDVINVILIYGSTRVVLDNPTFTDLTIKARALTNYQSRPWGFARYGATQVYIAPAPGAQYAADFDVATLSTTLVLVTDPDPLPYPYTKPIPYYAAYQAKINQRRWDEAEVFFGYFVKAMRDIEGSRVGQLLTAYTTSRGSKQSVSY